MGAGMRCDQKSQICHECRKVWPRKSNLTRPGQERHIWREWHAASSRNLILPGKVHLVAGRRTWTLFSDYSGPKIITQMWLELEQI
jgi:hypothetical protein